MFIQWCSRGCTGMLTIQLTPSKGNYLRGWFMPGTFSPGFYFQLVNSSWFYGKTVCYSSFIANSEKMFLSPRWESNPQPSDLRWDALTIELPGLRWQREGHDMYRFVSATHVLLNSSLDMSVYLIVFLFVFIGFIFQLVLCFSFLLNWLWKLNKPPPAIKPLLPIPLISP